MSQRRNNNMRYTDRRLQSKVENNVEVGADGIIYLGLSINNGFDHKNGRKQRGWREIDENMHNIKIQKEIGVDPK